MLSSSAVPQVGPGSVVYVAGAGPVGLACAASCHLLGAACVIVGDAIPERLAQARHARRARLPSIGAPLLALRAAHDASGWR